MIIYFSLFIPLLFLSAEASSIRGRNHKNDLVPFLSSRLDTLKKDPNSMKIVSKEPFIIQLQMPNSKEIEARAAKEKDKKRKRPIKKRVSKIKPLRKKHRKRRDLLTSKTKAREEKLTGFETPRAVNKTENQVKNLSRNSVNRAEILKALSPYIQKTESKRNKLEGIRSIKDEGKTNSGKTKKNNSSNRNLQKHNLMISDRTKMAYPSTPKLDRHPQKYTYKDLVADRERLEQKIKYMKNILNMNDSTVDDSVRVRRKSDSDRTANKIAKMFLTLSAVNGLHERRKSKCKNDDDDDDDDRVQDVWEKERRNSPFRRNTSSNEERYKVKKWIEFMKSKRSSGKTCPCMANNYGEESDAFPLEHKLPKGHFLAERTSSEESSELYRDPSYHSRDRPDRNDNVKKQSYRSQDQEGKNKTPNKNGKKKLELPFEDLELYRSRARQILQNAEEILDKIKEEEEKRLALPNVLMSHLKELTSRIQGDPRNNENDLIQKIQKNLGWGPLTRTQETTDGTFLDNVKSFILDPYEKAKSLTDESTKKLSSYLLRNLGKLQDSSEEQEGRNAGDKTDDENLKIYFGEVPPREEKPTSANLAIENPDTDNLSKYKEDLQNWDETLTEILSNVDDDINKESNLNITETPLQQKMEGVILEEQKELNDNKKQSSKETEINDDKEEVKSLQPEKEILAERKPERLLEDEKIATKLKEKETNNEETGESEPVRKDDDEKEIKSSEDPELALEKPSQDSDIVKNKKFRGMEETSEGEKGENNDTDSRNMQKEKEEEEFEKEIEEIVKSVTEKETDADEGPRADEEVVRNSKAEEPERGTSNEDIAAEVLKKQEDEDADLTETVAASPDFEQNTSEENRPGDSMPDQSVGKESYVSSPPVSLINEASPDDYELATPTETVENSKEMVKADLKKGEFASGEEPLLEEQKKFDDKQNVEELTVEENKSTPENVKESPKEDVTPSVAEELVRETEKQDLNDETEKEIGTKTLPEYADLVQEANQESKDSSEVDPFNSKLKDNLQSSETLEGETKMEGGETLKSENEKNQDDGNTTLEDADDETVKATLGNESDEGKLEEGTIENIPSEALDNQESSEDADTPLRETLENQENSNESFDNKSFSKESNDDDNDNDNDDALLKDQKNETSEKDSNDDVALKRTLEDESEEIMSKEENPEISLPPEPTEDKDEKEKTKNTENDNDGTLLKESNLYEGVSQNLNEEGDETPLRGVMSKQDQDSDAGDADETEEYKSSEVKKKDENLDKEESNETHLKASLNEDKDLEKDADEIILKETISNPTDGEGETQNLREDQRTSFDLDKLTDDGKNSKENQENDETESSDNLGVALNSQEEENVEMVEEAITSKENKEENINEKDETILRAQTSDENLRTEDKEASQETVKLISSKEPKNSMEKSSEETLQETNPNDSVQHEQNDNSEENSNENLEAISNNQKQKSLQVDEDEISEDKMDLSKPGNDENLKAVLDQTVEDLTEESDEGTLKAVKLENDSERSQKETNLEETLENEDEDEESKDEMTLKNVNAEESEQEKDNLNNNDVEEQNDKSRPNFDNDKGKRNEDVLDDDKILLKSENSNEGYNSQDNQNSSSETLKAMSNVHSEESLEENEENQKAENTHKEDEIEVNDDETPLKSASFEDEFDNKIEDEEAPLKSVQTLEEAESMRHFNEDESEETLQAKDNPEDFNNQIDQENKGENILKSSNFDSDFEESLNEGSYETTRAESLSNENQNSEDGFPLRASNPIDANPQENPQDERDQFIFLGDYQEPDWQTKSLRASNLKVPESIGKIMKDLEGKEKYDITSIQHLNPDKIDHMLDKIGEAELQNQLESEEVDCKKECACAEEMNMRSRNIGRYEIVKDFLHWVKDLQLNRVLSDD